jgi:hypothetical protein
MRAIHGIGFWLILFANVALGDGQSSLYEQRAKDYSVEGIDFSITKGEFLKRFAYAIRLNDEDAIYGRQSFGIGAAKATFLIAFFVDEELQILSVAFDKEAESRYGGQDKIIKQLSQLFGDPLVRSGAPTGWDFPNADRQICLGQPGEMFQITASSPRVTATLEKRKASGYVPTAHSRSLVDEKRPAQTESTSSAGKNLFYDPARELPYKANDISYHATRDEAIGALARQFERTPAWIELHLGDSNDLHTIHKNLWKPILAQELIKAKLTAKRKGQVDYSLVSTFRSAWQKDDMRNQPRALQAQGMALLQAIVATDVDDPADREATLDYIQDNIDSW